MSAEPNTYVQTISIADSYEESLLCSCGSFDQITFLGKLNCAHCGVYMQHGNPPLLVSTAPVTYCQGLKLFEDSCLKGHAISAQQLLANMQRAQTQLRILPKYHRADALKLMRLVHCRFKLTMESLHLAMRYLDMLPPESVKSGTWATMALTCFTLACKYVERDDDIPLIDDLIKAGNLARKAVTYE